MDERNSADAALRRAFPGLYITLVSIVIALAIEGLLGRLDELGSWGRGTARVVLVMQVVHIVCTASLFWWVSARWVTSVPWPFGVFDGFSTIIMLISFHYLSQSVGGSFSEWLAIFGIFSLLVAFAYGLNGHRGLVVNRRTDVDAQLLIPTGIAIGNGVAMLALAWWFRAGSSGSQQIAILVFVLLQLAAFGLADYRVWVRAANPKESVG